MLKSHARQIIFRSSLGLILQNGSRTEQNIRRGLFYNQPNLQALESLMCDIARSMELRLCLTIAVAVLGMARVAPTGAQQPGDSASCNQTIMYTLTSDAFSSPANDPLNALLRLLALERSAEDEELCYHVVLRQGKLFVFLLFRIQSRVVCIGFLW